MQVKDIMTREVISVAPSMKINEVAHVLTQYRIHGVPVVDEGKKLVGIVTETDFFVTDSPDLYLPSYINFMNATKMQGEIDPRQKERVETLMNASAKDIMTTECFTFSPEMDVIEQVIKVFQEKRLHTVPVVDQNGILDGIVTVADIIKLIQQP
jgi:CBS-domain-containing membrane protein